jgi:integrase
LIGQRPGEVAKMQPEEITTYQGKPVWKIPAHKYKTGREHWVPLTAPVLELIEPGLKNDYVFFSDYHGGARLDRLRARVNDVRKADGRKPMAQCVLHDLSAYFAAVAAFSINAATSCACERKIAWLPGSSMTSDCARFVMIARGPG